MHKLLKSAGWQLEGWLQRDGHRLLIKLLIAFGAGALIWALERRHDDESAALQRLLMQLSGRQTKRHRAITTSGMLAGLWVLQAAVGPLRALWRRPTQRHAGETLAPLFCYCKKSVHSLVETNARGRGSQ